MKFHDGSCNLNPYPPSGTLKDAGRGNRYEVEVLKVHINIHVYLPCADYGDLKLRMLQLVVQIDRMVGSAESVKMVGHKIEVSSGRVEYIISGTILVSCRVMHIAAGNLDGDHLQREEVSAHTLRIDAEIKTFLERI